jgi:hypothetical protein
MSLILLSAPLSLDTNVQFEIKDDEYSPIQELPRHVSDALKHGAVRHEEHQHKIGVYLEPLALCLCLDEVL